MSEEITPEESSFINAKRGFELFGTPLAPYTASRKVAAQTMGMQWPFIGEAALAQLQATNMYPGAIRDTAILLWLCTLPDASTALARGVWTPSRALSKPDEARDAALEWADKCGITDSSGPKFGEAFQVFFGIVTGVDAAQFRIEVEKTGGGESGDEPGKV
jgi:hypothetical protein